MAIRYQTLFGTKDQMEKIANLLNLFPKIEAIILDSKVFFPRATHEDNREFHFNELELKGPLKDLNKYFEVLGNSSDFFFDDLTNHTS